MRDEVWRGKAPGAASAESSAQGNKDAGEMPGLYSCGGVSAALKHGWGQLWDVLSEVLPGIIVPGSGLVPLGQSEA
jgi:hypothetical protein